MYTLGTIPAVKDYIVEQKFTWCKIATIDEHECAVYDETPAEKGGDTRPAAVRLSESVGAFLGTRSGDYIITCKRYRTQSGDNFKMRYQASQSPYGPNMNGPAGDLESIKAAVMADLRKEEQQREKEERLARLEGLNGQIVTAIEKAGPVLLDLLVARFAPNLKGMASAMNGPEVHHATDLDPHEVMNRLLMHTDIGLLNALADYVEKNPAIVDTIGPLIGYQKPPEFEPSKHTEDGQPD